MAAQLVTLGADPWLLKISLYLAIFGGLVFSGVGIALLTDKRQASGWITLLAALVTLALAAFWELFEAPPPPPPPVAVVVPEPAPPAAPEPVAEPAAPAPEAAPEPEKPLGPYALKIIEKNMTHDKNTIHYRAQGPQERAVDDLILGDAIQSSIYEFDLRDGFQKFSPSWKGTLRETAGEAIKVETKDHDPRGWVVRASADVQEIRQGLFQLGFAASEVRPRFTFDRNPSGYPGDELDAAMVKALVQQSNFSLGGHLLTNKGLLKDEIKHLNLLFHGTRYFVDVGDMQSMGQDDTGDDVSYTVSLTPGASD